MSDYFEERINRMLYAKEEDFDDDDTDDNSSDEDIDDVQEEIEDD